MFMMHWLKSLASHLAPRRRVRSRRFARPTLQLLENRLAPATTSFASNILTVNFTAASETVTIANNGTNVTVGSSGTVTGTTSFTSSTVLGLVVTDTGNLASQVLDLNGPSVFTFSKGLSISGVETVNTNISATISGGSISVSGAQFVSGAGHLIGSGSMIPLFITLSGPTTLSTLLTGTISLTLSGSGDLAFSSANTYTGATTINGGLMELFTANAIPSGSAVTLANSAAATLDLNNLNDTIASLSGGGTTGGNVGLGTGTLTTGNSSSTVYAGIISGTGGSLDVVGTGTFTLTGANAYTGGTTISQGTLAVFDLAGGDPLGTGTVTEAGGTLSMRGPQQTTQQAPVAVTGFNQDVIWGTSEASSAIGTGTTAAFDSVNSYVLYEQGVTNAPGGGLPTTGTFTSAANSAVNFQLQSYTQNNVVLLSQSATTQSLTLTTPGYYQSLNILDSATNGAATYSFTLNFADGTNITVSNQTAPDWFSGGTPALAGFGRVGTGGVFDNSYQTSDPELFENDYTLPIADQSKILNSISFTYGSGGVGNALGIFAVSGSGIAAGQSQSYPNNVVVTANSTLDVQLALTASLGTLQIGSNTLSLTGAAGANLTLGATALTGNATFSPAAGTTLTLGALNDGGSVQNPTFSGAGTVDLAAAATSLIAGNTVTLSNGITLIVANSTALGTATIADKTTLNFNVSGNLGVQNLINGPGTVNLTSTGTITQTAAITAPTLSAAAHSGITLTNAGNGVTSFTASNTISGAVSLADATATLTVPSITQPAAVAGTNISVTNTGNLIVTGSVTSGLGTVILQEDSAAAGTGTLTLNSGAAVTSANTGSSSITLRGAALNLQTGSTVSAVAPTVTTFVPNTIGLNVPQFAALDAQGNLYVANNGNNTVSKITPQGVVSTFVSGLAGPEGLAFDAAGNLYVANNGSSTVSKITPQGVASTFVSGLAAPEGLAFDAAGNLYVANNGNNSVSKITPQGVVSTFVSGLAVPRGLAFDAAGNLYVANNGNGTLSKVTSGGVVSTFASVGFGPFGLAFDAAGNLYVANQGNSTVSKVTSGGVVSTFVASGLSVPAGLSFDAAGNLYVANQVNGTVSKITPSAGPVSTFVSASMGLDQPEFSAMDAQGNLYVTNYGNNTVSKITSGGVVSTFVASGLSAPDGLAFDAAGNLYVANAGNNTVSKITSGGVVSTFVASGLDFPAGLAFDTAGNLYVANYGNGTVSKVTSGGVVSTFVASGLSGPEGLAFDTAGNLYVANYLNNTLSKITPSGAVSTFVPSGLAAPIGLAFDAAGNLYVSVIGNTVSKVTTQGVVSTYVASGLDFPAGLAFDTAGNLYVANLGNDTVSKVPSSGTVSTFVSGTIGLNNPQFSAMDAQGNLYVANYGSSTVSKITPQGAVSTFVSSGLSVPDGLAFDAAGNLYVANNGNNTVSKITPQGAVSTYITSGLPGGPLGMAFDAAGNLYVVNGGNQSVSKVTPQGVISTFVTGGTINEPYGLAFDANGNLYVSSLGGGAVDKVTPGGVVSTFVSSGLAGPDGLAFDAVGNLYVANYGNSTVIKVTPQGAVSTLVSSGLNGPVGLAFDTAGNLYVDNFNNSTISKIAISGTVVIRSSVPSRPMSIGGLSNAVAGINLTDAELGQIVTGSQGAIVFGDSSQNGNITFTTATPATTPGASVIVQQNPFGPGSIVLDNDRNAVSGTPGIALKSGGGTLFKTDPLSAGSNEGNISLSAGSAGIGAINDTNTIAEIATTATVTLDTFGSIGNNTNPIQFDSTNTPSSVVIGDVDEPQTGIFLNGLGALTLGAINIDDTSLTVTTAGALTASGAITLSFNGTVSLNAGTNTFTSTSAGSMNLGSGSVTVTADTIALGAAITVDGGGAIILQPSTAGRTIGLNDPAGAFNLTANELQLLSCPGGTITIGAANAGAVTIGGLGPIVLNANNNLNWTIEGGATTLSNTLTAPLGSLTLATGAITNNNGAILDGGGSTLVLTTSGNVGSSAAPLNSTVANLGTSTISGSLFLSDNSSLTTTGTISATGSTNLTMSNGNFTTQSGNLNAASTFLFFTGSSSENLTTQGQTLTNLTNSGVGGLILDDNLTLAGNFANQNSASNVTISNRTVTVGGNWGNSGSLVSTNSTVIFNGGNQSISGSSTFNNLTKTTTTSATLTFQAGSIQTVNGMLILHGATGNLLSLNSSTPGTQWLLNPLAYRGVSFVNVQDSFNTNITPLTAATSTDSGNNANWLISPGMTTTTLAISSNPAVAGQLIAFTATVAATGSSPTPSGAVSFFDGTTLIGTSILSGGVAIISTSLLSTGSHSITAVFSANANFNGSTSAPIVEQINPALATHFLIAPATTTPVAGTAFNFTVTALDAYNNTVTTYPGTVHFSSSDGQAVFGSNNLTLTSGVGTFSVTLKTAGSQTLTATDLITSTTLGNSAVTVSPAAAAKFTVSVPLGITAGVAFGATVTALDQFNNVATGYIGIVQFSTTAGLFTLPANSTLTQGVGTFPVVLFTAGNETVTATDTVTHTTTGTSGNIVVNPTADPTFAVTPAGPFIAGMPITFTVTAHDEFNNTAKNYSGTVQFSSSDGQAVFSANNVTLTNGTGSFTATFLTTGTRTLTATDTNVNTITGTSAAFTVNPGATSQLVFATQPGNTAAGALINPAVTVMIEDQYGNLESSDNTDQVTLAVASGPGSFTAGSTATVTASSGIATFSTLILATAGAYTLSESATGGLTGPASSAFNVNLAVTAFTVTPTGFTATFSQPFNNTNSGNTAQLNLYNSSSSNDGAADVTLVSNTTGKAVTGSLVIAPNNQSITFIKTTEAGTNGLPLANTWGLLPADTYTATLVSGSQAFETPAGLLLNGGTNYTTTFTVNPLATNAVVVTVPDFARGPDTTDLINVPNNSSPAVGIPIDLTLLASTQTIAFSSGVTGGNFRLSFNGSSTGTITWSSTPATLATNIKNGLAALANVGTGNVSVSVVGTNQLTATVTFAAAVANPGLMTVSVNSLSPSGSTIAISDPNAPANVTTATFTLDYNANLLTISGGTVNSSLNGATFTVTTSGSGSAAQATIVFQSTAGVNLGTLGSVLLGGLTATVPTNAAYKSKELLHFDLTSGSNNNTIDGGTVPVVTSDGLHVVAYPGDATGLGGSAYTSADSVNIVRVAGKADSGFGAFPIVDPVIIGNLSDNGLMDAGDATILNSVFTGSSPAQLPPYAGPASNNPSGPDPTVSIPTDLSAGLGDIVTVPVNIDDPVPAANAGMTEATLALKYDPALLSVSAADVRLGTVPASGTGWTLQVAVNQATGELGITLFSSTPITDPAGGSLVMINFHVNGTASPGATAINLVSAVNPTGFGVISTMVADTQGAFTLSSGPTGGANSANGIVTILAPAPVSVSVAEPAPAEVAVPPSESVSAVEVVEAMLPPTPPVLPVAADGRAEEALTPPAPVFTMMVSNVSATVPFAGGSPALQPINLALVPEDDVLAPTDGGDTVMSAATPLAAESAPRTDEQPLTVDTPAANSPTAANDGESEKIATDQDGDSALTLSIPTFAALRSTKRPPQPMSSANVFALDEYFARLAEELERRDT